MAFFFKDYYCGSIICGFRLPAGANRNGAKIPAGRLYLSFPVWTRDGLDLKQSDKAEAEEMRKLHMEEKDEELRKMQETANLFKKALHYRNAAAAYEKHDMIGGSWMKHIPSDDEVISIGDGLLMNKKGYVWTKEEGFFGAHHTPLGQAMVENHVDDPETDTSSPPLRP